MSFREISLKLSLPWISFIRVRQSSSTDAPDSSRLHGRKDNQNRPNLSLVRAIRMTCRRRTEFEVYPFTIVFQQFGMDLVSVHQLVMRSNEVRPQSNLICRTGPRSAWECLMYLWMHQFLGCWKSQWMTRKAMHVKITPYRLTCFRPSFTKNGQK